MKKKKFILACVLGACALAGAAQGQVREAAKKYRVSYEWATGAQSRYHYRYRIEIEPSGQGSIVMLPDHPAIHDADNPTWKETFPVAVAQLERLNGFIEANGMLSPEWGGASKGTLFAVRPPAAATCGIDIRTDTRSDSIPCNDWEVPPRLRRKRDEFVDMVKKIVPVKLWARVNDSQRLYLSR